MAKIIDGKGFAARLHVTISQLTSQMQSTFGITPGLTVVLVGDNPASQVYVRNKARQAEAAGIHSETRYLSAQISQAELLRLIDQLNRNPAVHGILVQLPLPAAIDPQAVIEAIDPAKDVDGFHPLNVGRLSVGGNARLPCTPMGCLLLLKDCLGDLAGQHAIVIGRSNIVGKPMALLLLRQNCTVTIAHSQTRHLAEECRRADIVVAAVGRPQLVKRDWIKPGATIIDVGMNRIVTDSGATRLVGDVDFPALQSIAHAITPVPGGVGPMTIACLLLNTLAATYSQMNWPLPQALNELIP
ncbi:MAG: bifunctional methylenetetrahydrofolate dehydrogenase/methenyltetrahydrofolate cyclohydrolase FolD [Gammaproteobacteria bacterium]|nr:bifunctional methylenetetrahydrofolate dehydrogenase/methenyltetrahydrofolate cyclohydrolase FolD [Gammaproteobacteria bacterium]MCP5425475.1 bifunctional methylenetetrahydrofolate dehydrogenase/methenyltetrahydrofolate cyclohydrolase FolD [Gammaproteobacteria bacterium]MCP5459922.1 bifunctional methylenetetrahydrofolate dehydrogenase/methenyltetrahydrofolate cyclohydrolase FolD [Gammaproteobacteria bacterium]